MRCPTLAELVLVGNDRMGWPWTEASDDSFCPKYKASLWPKISIVTPSFNQVKFLEETIRSVLLQGYPHFEYIIIDGGSTDGSVDIIKKYERWLAYWISELDGGQSYAINEGFRHATGDIFAWINSDDLYLPNAFVKAAKAFQPNPSKLIAGSVIFTHEFQGSPSRVNRISQHELTFENLVEFWNGRAVFQQPGIFFPSKAWKDCQGLDESFKFALDYEFLCRILQHTGVTYVDDYLAIARLHESAKTFTQRRQMYLERIDASKRYWHLISGIDTVAFRSFTTNYFVKLFAAKTLAGEFPESMGYLLSSLDISIYWTVINLFRNLLVGCRKYIGAAIKRALV
jgi:glycosyltransferase involved in cell wall biosynthesis